MMQWIVAHSHSKLEIDEGRHSTGPKNFDEGDGRGYGRPARQSRPSTLFNFNRIAPSRRHVLPGEAEEQNCAYGRRRQGDSAGNRETPEYIKGKIEAGC